MQFSNLFNIAALATAVSAVTVSYDTNYDNTGLQVSSLSCSDGANGLTTKYGWTTISQIANYPLIAGAEAVAGWNSANCGTCWELSYNGNSIVVMAVDHAGSGFNLPTAGLNQLTNGRAVEVGRIDATATQVALSRCGIN